MSRKEAMSTQASNAAPSAGAHATLVDARTLRISRKLPATAERVWAYLVDGKLRRGWLAAGDLEARAGAAFELIWRNDELSASPAERPEGFPEESRATCQVTEVVEYRRLAFSWPGVGEVSFELEPEADGVRLTVTHRGLADRAATLMVGAGWHIHLDILVARLGGTPAASFWSGWLRLRAEYERRLAA